MAKAKGKGKGGNEENIGKENQKWRGSSDVGAQEQQESGAQAAAGGGVESRAAATP